MECSMLAADIAAAMETYSFGHTIFMFIAFGAGAVIGHFMRQLQEKSEAA